MKEDLTNAVRRCLSEDADVRTVAAQEVGSTLQEEDAGPAQIEAALARAGVSADELFRQLFRDSREAKEAWQEACRLDRTGDALFDRVIRVELAASGLMERIEPLIVEAVDVLGDALRTGDQGTRMEASRLLGKLGARAAAIRDDLVSAIRVHGIDHRPFGIAAALGAIAAVDPADQSLDGLLDEPEGEGRFAACLALSEAGPGASRYAPRLRRLLADPSVGGAAAEALAATSRDDPATLPAILGAWASVEGPGDARRGWFASALAKAGARDPHAVLAILLEIAADDDELYRQGRAPGGSAAEAALELLSAGPDDDELTRQLREAHARWGAAWPDELDEAASGRLGVPRRQAPEPEAPSAPKARRMRRPRLSARMLRDVLGRRPAARSAALAQLREVERWERWSVPQVPLEDPLLTFRRGAAAFHASVRATIEKAALAPDAVARRLLALLLECEDAVESDVLGSLLDAVAAHATDFDELRRGLGLPRTRDACARVLAAHPEEVAGCLEVLVPWLRDEELRHAVWPLAEALAAGARSSSGPRVVAALTELLDCDDVGQRRNACVAFRAMGPSARSALDRVLALLDDDETIAVAAAAAAALAPEDERVARRILDAWTLASPERADWLRPKLVEALAALRGRDDEVVPLLASTIVPSEWGVEAPDGVFEVLAARGPAAAPAVGAVLGALEVSATEGTTDFALVQLLGRIGPPSRDAVPLLEWIERGTRRKPKGLRKGIGRWTPGKEFRATAREALAAIRGGSPSG